MDEDRERWDRRWAELGPQQTGPRMPDVLAAHRELLTDVPTAGTALDLACGLGAQTLWLAARGLSVTALDVSAVAIDALDASADRHDLDIVGRVHDIDDGLPADLTDLAVILCQRYRSPDLYAELPTRLRTGGILILTVLSAVGCAGNPGEFHAPAGELLQAFGATGGAALDVLIHVEGDGQASIVGRRR